MKERERYFNIVRSANAPNNKVDARTVSVIVAEFTVAYPISILNGISSGAVRKESSVLNYCSPPLNVYTLPNSLLSCSSKTMVFERSANIRLWTNMGAQINVRPLVPHVGHRKISSTLSPLPALPAPFHIALFTRSHLAAIIYIEDFCPRFDYLLLLDYESLVIYTYIYICV